ncbi:hypothetical protein HQ533_04470 [Candidatus Woesearchaeota archaeon]|nr:hypothetical protein [Candidatus Woesearchaeota archaeon]
MNNIILISCVKKKLSYKAKAKELYISPLFKYNLRYAQSLNPDKIFILSAKYGLTNLEDSFEPYNETLNDMSRDKNKLWAEKVIKQLSKKTNIKKDLFLFLAGERYRKYLLPHLSHYKIPLQGLGIGKQLKYLKKRVSNE